MTPQTHLDNFEGFSQILHNGIMRRKKYLGVSNIVAKTKKYRSFGALVESFEQKNRGRKSRDTDTLMG